MFLLQSTGKPEHKISKNEGSVNTAQGQTDLSVKPDNVKIKGLQANVTIPKVTMVPLSALWVQGSFQKMTLTFFLMCGWQVNLCVLQASVEENSPTNKSVTHVSLVALCFDRIATQLRMNR